MRLNYQITSFPEDVSGYNLTAHTEGVLRVRLNTTEFLSVSGVLLVELAVVLHKWLLSVESGETSLYYASMDFEEEPILALNFDPTHGYFIPESVWGTADPIPVSFPDAKRAARTFLTELREELRAKHGVDLDETLEAAVMEESR